VAGRKNGRIGVGSSYQCYHGGDLRPQLIVDWQPFEQYTYKASDGHRVIFTTVRLTPVESGTRLSFLVRIEVANAMVTKIIGPLLRVMMTRGQSRRNAELRAQIEKDIEEGDLFRPEAQEIQPEEIGKAIREKLATEPP
jgi:hypothetical protein